MLLVSLIGALGFASVDLGLTTDTLPSAGYSAADTPFLDVSKLRGHLRLSGHTASSQHEKALLQTAAAVASNAQLSTEFLPLGTVPDAWMPASIALLESLAGTVSARATLNGSRLRIRGVGASNWKDAESRLRQALPEFIQADIEMIITDDGIDSRDLCKRAFAEFRTGAINFEESTILLRESARPSMDRAISLADACRSSTLVITGHTDATGPEAWNRQLSLARANVVADYLRQGGIAGERLRTEGAGSAVPLANNESRYGRSLNRRIEIRFESEP